MFLLHAEGNITVLSLPRIVELRQLLYGVSEGGLGQEVYRLPCIMVITALHVMLTALIL